VGVDIKVNVHEPADFIKSVLKVGKCLYKDDCQRLVSLKAQTTAQVCLHELERIQPGQLIDLVSLKAAKIIPRVAKQAKIIASGKLTQPVKIKGIVITKGARAAIEAAGGSIED
jgi:ribosomal protein L15